MKNVYADTGQLFAHTTISQPRLAAGIMGTLVKGMGQLEIPEDMQKQYGYTPLGAAAASAATSATATS